MEWHFIIYTSDGIYSMNSSEYQINLTKSAIKENSELLRSNVKRVINIIVRLLKDRVSVDNSSTSKRLESKKLLKNNMYHGKSLKPLYLFFTCINKKFFLANFSWDILVKKHIFFYFECLYTVYYLYIYIDHVIQA
jgi:hypothetical protein